jgi:hypothetical protein
LTENKNSVAWRRERFRALCLEGATREAIAAELVVSMKHVRKYAKELGLPTPPFRTEDSAPVPLPVSSLTPRSKLWDEARNSALRALWGVSALKCEDIANRINEEFGATFTKNSIIGRAGRIGLPTRVGLGERGSNRGGHKNRTKKPAPDGTQSGADARREFADAVAAKRQAEQAAIAAAEAEVRREAAKELAKARAEVISAAVPVAPVELVSPIRTAPAIIEPSPPATGGISIFALRSATRDLAGTCRWPLDGDKTSITTRYCGEDTAFGKVYCDTHRRIAYPNAKFRPGSSRFIKPGAADRVFGVHTV